jgi:outer membrane protein OmpA-like peptidoglycan-associated protein
MGEVPAMSDNIGRLKELLFESETQTLANLARRIEGLAGEAAAAHAELAAALKDLGETEGRTRSQIAARLDELAARVGDDERLEASVAAILDGALRKADVTKHGDVADAVAPFVVKTVRTEIRNSKDELVEALYPVTGRIVKAYVASAMKDLMAQINRRLEANPFMLRMQSLATGRPVAELAIAASQRLDLEELYLIRRGTGELVEHWPPAAAGDNRDQVMSGVLAAINEFATQAFEAQSNALRQIDLGDDRVYLRESPTYLLAAKCAGSASEPVEEVLDEGFLTAISRMRSTTDDAARPPVLAELAETLTARLSETQEQLAGQRSGFSPIKLVAWMVGLPLAAWLAWNTYGNWQTARVDRIAHDVLSTSAEIKGYPSRVATDWLGRSVTVAGLVPTTTAKEQVLQRLAAALPETKIQDEFAIVPNALADVEPELQRLQAKAAVIVPELERLQAKAAVIEPELERLQAKAAVIEPSIGKVREEVAALERKFALEAERADIARASRRLARAKATIESLLVDLAGDRTQKAREALTDLDRSISELARSGPEPVGTKELAVIAERTRAASRNLATMLTARPPSEKMIGDIPATTAGAALAAAEEIDMVAVALAQTVALQRSLPVASARDKLEDWTRANAIFFAGEAEYRDPDAAARKIAELAGLMKSADVVVRVIGYTDGLGGSDRNSPLSVARAEKVAAGLRASGVPASRIVAIGRALPLDISAETGTGSPNRRVEFELGFEGEARE